MSATLAWSLAEIGRVGFTHALDPAPIAVALGMERAALKTLFAAGTVDQCVPSIEPRSASYVLNILIRHEVRCRGDGAAIRAALARPCADLGSASISEALAAGPDFPQIVVIRAVAGELPVLRVKMWRVADSHS